MDKLFGKKDVKGRRRKNKIDYLFKSKRILLIFFFNFKEELREQNKVLRSAQRDIERDRNQLEREKKRLEMEIKKAAKDGNKQVCVILGLFHDIYIR